jgi:hypothetical protein
LGSNEDEKQSIVLKLFVLTYQTALCHKSADYNKHMQQFLEIALKMEVEAS